MVMALIQVTPDLLTGKATELRGYKSEHDEAMRKMGTMIRGLSEIWKGEAQDAFLAKYFNRYDYYCVNKVDEDETNYVYYTGVSEDVQADDLTLLAIKRM